MKDKTAKRFPIRTGGVAALLSSYIFVFYEWLFQVTKISFLDSYSLLQNISVPLVVPLFLLPFSGVTIIPILLVCLLRRCNTVHASLGWFALLAPALVTTAMLFLVIDHFTYTVWGFNAGSFQGSGRFVYAALFVALSFLMLVKLMQWTSISNFILSQSVVNKSLVGLIMLSLFIGWIAMTPYHSSETTNYTAVTTNKNLPDIIIFSTDGLDAARLPVYGYERNTSPFISILAEESLVFQNAFSNGSHTTGAVGSLFTGKLPTHTHMIYPPDMFKGKDAYQHLPGILRNLGYKTADISIRHYADPHDRGLREAFHFANGRSLEKRWRWIKFLSNYFPLQTFFGEHIVGSITERFSHIYGMQNYFNPYLAVVGLRETQQLNLPVTDSMKLAMDFIIENEKKPIFLHVHLLGTHGPYFNPTIRHFSAGQQQTTVWMQDFFDDVILEFDGLTRKLVENLRQMGRFENSIFIVTSDHGSRWTSLAKIPLIIRLPHGKIQGTRNENVQYIDLPPTILDILGQPVPEWMEGRSLCEPPSTEMRPIFSVQPKEWKTMVDGWKNVGRYAPPFYSLGKINTIIGDRWYSLNVENGKMEKGRVSHHTGGVSLVRHLSESKVRKMLIDHLTECGYDVSSLQ